MSPKNEDTSDGDRDDKNPCHQQPKSGESRNGQTSWSSKQVRLDFCLDEKGPNAAKKFNDLIAKTLKLQE
ncbi:MAG TPA: hypothetical protein V6C89_18800 [Drouetiella sp.]|jgi:hypothetical protein